MKFKKSLVFLLILLLTFPFLAISCRKKAPIDNKKNYSGIELTYYKVFDDTEVFESAINKYLADHPGLKIHYKKFSDFDEYQRVILNEMAEGEGPDIFSMPNTWFMSNYRKLVPMPSKFGKIEDFRSTFADVAAKDLIRPDKYGDDQIYALPMTIDTLAVYYNKSHFEDAIPERGKPSATWEGIKEDVILLNKEDTSFDRFEVSGIAMGRADNITRAVDILYLLFLQHGLNFYDEKITEAIFAGKQNTEGSFPGLQALELYTSFADNSQKHFSWNELLADDDSNAREIAAFAEGKVSMIIGYSYMLQEIADQIDLLDSRGIKTIDKADVKVAPIPQLYDPSVSKEKRVTYASYFAETVSRNSDYPEIAWDFLLYMTSKENLADYFAKANKPTSRRDMIEDQKSDPKYGVFASQIGYGESFPIFDYYTYKKVFTDLITNANLNGTAQSDLGYAQDIINELVPDEGLFVLEEKKKEKEGDGEKTDESEK